MATEDTSVAQTTVRRENGDIHICITINNNVAAAPAVAGGGAVPVAETLAPPPAGLTPPQPPDTTLPLPWRRATGSTFAGAALILKGSSPEVAQGTRFTVPPYEPGTGDRTKQRRFRLNEAALQPSTPYGGKLVSAFLTHPIDTAAGIFRGFAVAEVGATATSATFITDVAPFGATPAVTHQYATHAVTTPTTAAVLASTSVPADPNFAFTIAGAPASTTFWIVVMPHRIDDWTTTTTYNATYLPQGAWGSLTTSGAGAGSLSLAKPSTPGGGRGYYAFLTNADPASATVLGDVVSNVLNLTA